MRVEWKLSALRPGVAALLALTLVGSQACSLRSTLPPSHAAAASVRLLKKRAAHSHLSTRMSAMTRVP